MAALLANRAVGLVELTLARAPDVTRQMQAWVARRREIHADAWPEPSLESHLARLAGPEPRSVYDVITAWKSRTWRGIIWQVAAHEIKHHLVERGIITADDGAEDAPGISYPCRLTPETAALLPHIEVGHVHHMLDACKANEPDLWMCVDRGIWLWGQMSVPS